MGSSALGGLLNQKSGSDHLTVVALQVLALVQWQRAASQQGQ
jgi:hypothetical protein